MEKAKKIIIGIAILIVIVLIGVVGVGIFKNTTMEVKNPIATMEIEGYGAVKIELYPDKAPNTVANFIKLAERGFYNDLTFHRTIPDFMIQGGDKKGDGTGTPTLRDLKGEGAEEKEYGIKGEFLANDYENTLKHTKGVISMARSDYSSMGLTKQGYNSAGSQFFIMTSNNSSLDGLYSAFGKVIEGYDIIEKISNVEVTYRSSELAEGKEAPKDEQGNQLSADMPKNKPVIKSITVETFGVDYGEPETVDAFDYQSYLSQMYGASSNNAGSEVTTEDDTTNMTENTNNNVND
ncbi:MAG: peptidylprolyl isomerase [Clostridia bacterium]|nr:peptidylprolyl isomerase [Clostridia bacterium]